MANNYRQFSAGLSLSAEEKVWAEKRLDELRRTPEAENAEPVGEDEDLARYEGRADFEWNFDPDGVCFYGEESGNVEHVADFVAEYLSKFHPDQCWSMTWADTCSKMRVGEFSGGAVFVTAKRVQFMEAGNWADKQAQKFAKRKKSVKRKKSR